MSKTVKPELCTPIALPRSAKCSEVGLNFVRVLGDSNEVYVIKFVEGERR